MARANYSHQKDIFDPRAARKVVVFGAGSVASLAVFHLGKKGVLDIEVWDDDIVASHNSPMSLYGPQDVGRYKVEVLQELMLRLTGITIAVRQEKYTGQVPLRNVSVVSCVDKMKARRVIWQKVKKNTTVDIFCDSRTGGSYYEVHSVAPCVQSEIDQYEASLCDDKDTVLLMCGRHGIIDNVSEAARVISASVSRFWMTGDKQLLVAGRSDIFKRVI